MSEHDTGATEDPQGAAGLAALREIFGESSPEGVTRAIEELERQIALEDLIVVLMDTTREAARTFFDLMLQIHPQPGGGDDVGPRQGAGS